MNDRNTDFSKRIISLPLNNSSFNEDFTVHLQQRLMATVGFENQKYNHHLKINCKNAHLSQNKHSKTSSRTYDLSGSC